MIVVETQINHDNKLRMISLLGSRKTLEIELFKNEI